MKENLRYVTLNDFMTGIYCQLMRAEIQAKGMQTEYLARMASHEAPLPVLEMIRRLELESFTLNFSFRQTTLHASLLTRLLYFLKIKKRPPEGIYLELTSKDQPLLSFSVVLSKAAQMEPVINPVPDSKINYYVLTEPA